MHSSGHTFVAALQESRSTQQESRLRSSGCISARSCLSAAAANTSNASATAARTSGPCAKESCRTPILNKQFHSCRSNQQVNCLTLRRLQRYLSASGSDLPKTTLPCQAGHAGPGVGWSKPRTAHGSRDGIADATRAPCGPIEDFVAPRTSVQMLVLSAACPTSWPCCQGRDRYHFNLDAIYSRPQSASQPQPQHPHQL